METVSYKKKIVSVPGRLVRFCRYWRLRLLRIQASPYSIAMGLACGVFAGLMPILPLQTALALLLAFVCRGSKVAAVLGTWVSNPLNVVPQYMLVYYMGRAVTPFPLPPFDPTQLEVARVLDMGWPFAAAMLTGGLLLAVPGAAFTYALVFRGVRSYRQRRRLARADRSGYME